MYRNLIFDLYGTLIELHSDEMNTGVWKRFALFYSFNGARYEPEELRETYFHEAKIAIESNHETRYPDIKIEEIFKILYTRKGVEANEALVSQTTRVFRALTTVELRLYPGVIEMLSAFKKNGKKLILLSNAQREFSIPELKYLGIDSYFDACYFSSDYKMCKPDERFFQKMLDSEKITSEDSIMIGNDSATDIAGASKVGMDSLYINNSLSVKPKKIKSKYLIMDGDFHKIRSFLI